MPLELKCHVHQDAFFEGLQTISVQFSFERSIKTEKSPDIIKSKYGAKMILKSLFYKMRHFERCIHEICVKMSLNL